MTIDVDKLRKMIQETRKPSLRPYFIPLTPDDLDELLDAYEETNRLRSYVAALDEDSEFRCSIGDIDDWQGA